MESGLFCVGERMTNVYRRIKSEFFSAGGRMVNIYLSIEWFVLRGWSYSLCDNIMVSCCRLLFYHFLKALSNVIANVVMFL